VAAPTIILQLIITIVFFDSIWIKVNKNLTRSLVAQLKTVQEVYTNDKKNLDFFTDSFKNTFNFEIGIVQEIFPSTSGERRFSPMDRSLRRELKSAFGNNNYWFNTSRFKNAVEIKIKSNEDILEFLVPKDMVSASSIRLFLLWTTLPSVILVFRYSGTIIFKYN
jgi:two-component system osmolarity sensor histidine kinase EnvZ